MNMINKEKSKELNFLTELKELCEKYNYRLAGCGCCGSPFVYDYSTESYLLDNVNVNVKEKIYNFDTKQQEYTGKTKTTAEYAYLNDKDGEFEL